MVNWLAPTGEAVKNTESKAGDINAEYRYFKAKSRAHNIVAVGIVALGLVPSIMLATIALMNS